jgi:hypothetical protein
VQWFIAGNWYSTAVTAGINLDIFTYTHLHHHTFQLLADMFVNGALTQSRMRIGGMHE